MDFKFKQDRRYSNPKARNDDQNIAGYRKSSEKLKFIKKLVKNLSKKFVKIVFQKISKGTKVTQFTHEELGNIHVLRKRVLGIFYPLPPPCHQR